jgi:protein-L-isoaspartate(D-aspartate) O-methyltransferase
VTRLTAAALRLQLAEELGRSGVLRSANVRAAFLRVPRELFVPSFAAAEGLEAVYSNRLIVTKRDRDGAFLSSSSEPQIMAAMLEALELREGMRVLEIGTGSGYNTALLKALVGPQGRVVSVELDRELASAARRTLRAVGCAVRVVHGDGHDGYAPGGLYDRIIATASTARVPRTWLDQLAEDGLLELPLRLRPEGALAISTFRREGERLEATSIVPGRFMPLRGVAADAPPPVLTVRTTLEDGRPIVTRLGGGGLAHLSRTAQLTLAAVADARPRIRTLGVRTASWPLGLYLSLELPERRLVMRYADLAIGIVGRGGRSLALVPGRWEGGQRPTSHRLVAFGGDEAEERLTAALDAWAARGRPGREQLRIRIDFDGPTSSISHHWIERSR